MDQLPSSQDLKDSIFKKLAARVAELEERIAILDDIMAKLREAKKEPTEMWRKATGQSENVFPGFAELFRWLTAELTQRELDCQHYKWNIARLRSALAKYADHDDWAYNTFDCAEEYGWEIAEAALKGGE